MRNASTLASTQKARTKSVLFCISKIQRTHASTHAKLACYFFMQRQAAGNSQLQLLNATPCNTIRDHPCNRLQRSLTISLATPTCATGCHAIAPRDHAMRAANATYDDDANATCNAPGLCRLKRENRSRSMRSNLQRIMQFTASPFHNLTRNPDPRPSSRSPVATGRAM